MIEWKEISKEPIIAGLLAKATNGTSNPRPETQILQLIHDYQTAGRVYNAFPNRDEFLGLVFHDILKGRETSPLLQALFPPGARRTIQAICERIVNRKLSFSEMAAQCPWFQQCVTIYAEFDMDVINPMVIGSESKEQLAEFGGEYLLIDGGHRAIVVAVKLAEGMEYFPIEFHKFG